MDLSEFQGVMKERFGDFDRESGPFFLMTVLSSEVGELADAVKNEDVEGVGEELADVLFALVSIANIYDLDIDSILEEKYLMGDVKELTKKWAEPFLGDRVKKFQD
jgi:NTP pyrophosphatase (non-canonical NTP hydrolase)